MPEGWAFTTLGDLSSYVTSGSRDWSKYYSNEGVLFIRTQDINQNKLTVLSDIARVALPKQIEGKRTLTQQGDLLITITGANVGKCAYVDQLLPEAYVSQSIALVKLVDGLNGHFFHRQLMSPSTEDERTLLQRSAYGVGRPVLNLDNVKEVPLCIAPLSEQLRITAKVDDLLSHVDSARDHLSRVPAILKRFRQAVLAAACSGRLTEDWREVNRDTLDPLSDVFHQNDGKGIGSRSISDLDWTIPNLWRWTTLGDIAEVVGGITKGQKRRGNEKLRSVPYLRVANVQRGFIDLSEIKYIDATEQEISDLRLLPGDILFTEGGDRDKLGRGWVWNGEISECIHQNHIFRARLRNDRIQGKLVSWFANLVGQAYFIDEGKQTVNLASINLRKLRAFPVPLVPANEQEEIVRRLESLFGLASTIEHHVSDATIRADKLTQSILGKAFRGELVPTEAELARREGRDYEPASVLLERIKKQREAEPAKSGSTTSKVAQKTKAVNASNRDRRQGRI